MFSAALYLQALVYFFFVLHGVIGAAAAVVLGNACVAASFSALQAALHRLQQRALQVLAFMLPVIAVVFLLSFAMGSDRGRTIATHSVYFVQSVMIIRTILRYRENFPVRGRSLVLFSVATNAGVSLLRILVSALMLERYSSLLNSDAMLLVSYLSVCFTIVFLSNGFLIMARERSDARLREMAMTDSLTGCWNRLHLEQAAQAEMERLSRYGTPVSLLLIDIDHFKSINDQHGHTVGDEVLKELVSIVQGSIRGTDILGRWGGEEFVVLQSASSFPDSLRSAERIRKRVEAHKFSAGLRVTASIGVSVCRSTDSWIEWLERADRALYSAKSSGRNRVWTEGMHVVAEFVPDQKMEIPHLQWKASYSCGLAEIDHQHEDLTELVNQLFVQLHSTDPREKTAEALRHGMDALWQHFASEERLMTMLGMEKAQEHTRIHRALADRAEKMVAMYLNESIGPTELMHFLSYEMVMQHIMIEDQEFFREVGESRSGSIPRACGDLHAPSDRP